MITAATTRHASRSASWRADVFAYAVVLLAIPAFWVSWASMFDVWDTRPGYSHGFLVVAVAALMFVVRRRHLQDKPVEPVPAMLVPLVALCLLWLIMVLASIQVAHQLLVPAMTWCAICAVCGWRVALLLLVPTGYIVTAIPVWDIANPVLQAMTVAITDGLLSVAGIPAYIEQNIVTLPNGVFEIAGGCSGLHFFIVGLSVSVLYGYMFVSGIVRFSLIVIVGLTCALVANWVRVYTVIVAGYVTEMQHFLVTVDHYYFGWLVFALFLVPFYFLARKIEIAAPGSPRAYAGPPPRASRRTAGSPGFVMFFAAATMLAAGAIQFVRGQAPEVLPVRIDLPTERAGWWQEDVSGSIDWRPVFPGPTTEVLADYTDGEKEFQVYVNVYRTQAQGRELVGFDSRIEGEGRWRRLASGPAKADGMQELLLVDRYEGRRIVIYWYEVGGKRADRDLEVKLRYAVRRLLAAPIAGIVAISGRCRTDCAHERDRILAWIGACASSPGAGLAFDDIVSVGNPGRADRGTAAEAQIMCID